MDESNYDGHLVDRLAEDQSGFAWVRYYASFVVLATLIGVLSGSVLAIGRADSSEVWTYLVQTPFKLPRSQLALMSKAMFATPVVYEQARTRLGDSIPRQEFLANVDLRPVPQTSTLIIVGRGTSADEARDVSLAAADGLLEAFARAGVSEFQVLGYGPGLAASRFADRVVIAVAGVAALLIGLALALAHYGVKRPVLSLERAISLSRPSRVLRPAGGRSLMGARRVHLPSPWPPSDAAGVIVHDAGGGARVHLTASKMSSQVAATQTPAAPRSIVVAGRGTAEENLLRLRSASGPGDDVALVWVG